MGWRAGMPVVLARLSMCTMKTLVVGLGNPILGDDGVGWVVAEEVKKRVHSELAVDVDCLSLGGISLMERLIGYERAILIDAFAFKEEEGSIIVSTLDQLPKNSAFHLISAHDTSLQNAMQMGRQLGVDLPEDVIVVGVSAIRVYDFSEELSAPVQAAVSKMVELVMQKITIH
jgi:hydrogenase maturation protease